VTGRPQFRFFVPSANRTRATPHENAARRRRSRIPASPPRDADIRFFVNPVKRAVIGSIPFLPVRDQRIFDHGSLSPSRRSHPDANNPNAVHSPNRILAACVGPSADAASLAKTSGRRNGRRHPDPARQKKLRRDPTNGARFPSWASAFETAFTDGIFPLMERAMAHLGNSGGQEKNGQNKPPRKKQARTFRRNRATTRQAGFNSMSKNPTGFSF